MVSINPSDGTGAKVFSATPHADAGMSYEVDPDYLEHTRREALDEHDQPDLPWDA